MDYEYEVATIKHNSLIKDTKWRVKLYSLNSEGVWDDKGTGHIFIHKNNNDYYLAMSNEYTNEKDESSNLFEILISKDIDFHRQRGTILTWKGKTEIDEDDTAVSFQDQEGVQEIWKSLCEILGKDSLNEIYEDQEDEESVALIPEPSIENLVLIAKEIKTV